MNKKTVLFIILALGLQALLEAQVVSTSGSRQVAKNFEAVLKRGHF